MTTDTMHETERNDADLVADSLDGHRDAFRQIVERYQTLVCSLAYSATGKSARARTWPRRHSSARGRTFGSCVSRTSFAHGCAASSGTRLTETCGRKGTSRCETPPLWTMPRNRRPAKHCPPNKPSTGRRKRSCGVRWRRSPRITVNRSSCSTANTNRSSTWRRSWNCLKMSSGSDCRADASCCRRRFSPRGEYTAPDGARPGVRGRGACRPAPGHGSDGGGGCRPGSERLGGSEVGSSGRVAVALYWNRRRFRRGAMGDVQRRLQRARAPGKTQRTHCCVDYRPGIFDRWTASRAMAGGHLGWDDRRFFSTMAWFWWFYAMVITTWIVAVYRWNQRLRQPDKAAAETPCAPAAPMKPGMRVLTVIGTNLMLFWCIILLAWRANDRITAGISVGIMLALSGWHLVLSRRTAGMASLATYIVQLASGCP